MTDTFRLDIQTVEAGGRSAWLIKDQSVPVVSIAWAWRGGAALDPAEHAGALSMGAALLTEGAGDLDNRAFADALRDEAIGLGFGAERDGFEGSLRALRTALPEAVRLANLAMRAPRLDQPAVARVRARAVAGARAQLETPRGQVGRAFWAAAFPDHPAGRPTGGTVETLSALPEEAIRAALTRQIRSGGLLVAAAGAITPDELTRLMPALFEGLPPGAPPEAPPLPAFTAFDRRVVEVASPQSAILFGQPGLPVTDPEWETAQVVLRVLAGGGFSSRLMEAVRVKRGLAYGIGAGLDVLFGQGIVVGSSATDNARVAETLAVTREEWARMAAEGPTREELDDAVAFLTGNLPLQFTDSRRIAGTLLALRRNGRPLDWLNARAERLRGLTTAQTTAVAQRLLEPGALSVAIAGQPVGL
ncbi:insulinase family protein [Falsiroseomonas bella]|uniref:Insulinase family protein n=1 Tax=Falsiroseomonas bella TaxID=2184016 RepID=A0A317FGK0_9PROT|nr:pitrilysin family protein [Falsiroseomonas bella]PWS38191.1 insulinase family protein [Falsiroseomonas bella]